MICGPSRKGVIFIGGYVCQSLPTEQVPGDLADLNLVSPGVNLEDLGVPRQLLHPAELGLGCDLIVASDRARISEIFSRWSFSLW